MAPVRTVKAIQNHEVDVFMTVCFFLFVMSGESRCCLGGGLRAVKLLRREMGRYVREDDFAEWIAPDTQLAPGREIGRAEHSVNAGRPADGKLKRSNQLLQPDELDRQRVSEYGDALIPQRDHRRDQICCGGQRFG